MNREPPFLWSVNKLDRKTDVSRNNFYFKDTYVNTYPLLLHRKSIILKRKLYNN